MVVLCGIFSACSSDSNSSSNGSSDTQAPVFNGLSSATAIGSNAINLGWTAASDNVSAAASIQYNAYVATASAAQDFSHPYANVQGASGMILSGLMATTNYYIVVRAQDQSGNEDSNVTEIVATTGSASSVTLSADVQPIFTASCITGCHGGAYPASNLNLTVGNSYAQLVNVAAAGCSGGEIRVVAGDSANSELAKKILGVGFCSGTQMPKLGSLSAAEVQIIIDWIDNGALDN